MNQYNSHPHVEVKNKSKRHLSGVEWTDDEIKELINSWKCRESFQKFARRIGRTPKAVIVKACRLGLTERPYWNDQYVTNARRNGKSRRCLSCNNLFFSEGSGNRICLQCKETKSWKSGNDCNAP